MLTLDGGPGDDLLVGSDERHPCSAATATTS
jgi:hypothetical protein